MDGGGGVGVGSFKGVMLCNRPPPSIINAHTRAVTGHGHGNDTAGPFLSTVLHSDPLGLQRGIDNQKVRHSEVVPKHRNKDADLTFKHKKWLQTQQVENAQRLTQEYSDVQKAKARRQQFDARCAQLRAIIRNTPAGSATLNVGPGDAPAVPVAFRTQPSSSSSSARLPDNVAVVLPDSYLSAEPPAALSSSSSQPLSSAPTAAAAAPTTSASAKPAWARSAEEADEARDDEVESLLEFTKNLDFDAYMGDLDVKEALSFVQQRVRERDAAAQQDAVIQAALEARAARAAQREAEGLAPEDDDMDGTVRFAEDVGGEGDDGSGGVALKLVDHEQPWNYSTKVDVTSSDTAAAAAAAAATSSSRGVGNQSGDEGVLFKAAQAAARQQYKAHMRTSAAALAASLAEQKRCVEMRMAAEARLAAQSTIDSDGVVTVVSSDAAAAVAAAASQSRHSGQGGGASNLPFLYRHPGI